jgi:transcriptional regulator with XRE-family HTH domain
MIGAELRAWRKRLSISTEDAARLLGKSVGSLQSKQAGRRRIRPSTALAAGSIELLIRTYIWPLRYLAARHNSIFEGTRLNSKKQQVCATFGIACLDVVDQTVTGGGIDQGKMQRPL